MEKFQEKMMISRETKDIIEEDSFFRLYNRITFNEDVWLSVQGSFGHYCTPRKTLPIAEYEELEVMANVPDKYVTDWEEFDAGENVYGFVPVSKIQKLIDELAEVYGEPTYE